MEKKELENIENGTLDAWVVCDECGLEVRADFAYAYTSGKVKCILCGGKRINLIRSKIPA
jgi:formylmethanofuran dehydrogenase subunit E